MEDRVLLGSACEWHMHVVILMHIIMFMSMLTVLTVVIVILMCILNHEFESSIGLRLYVQYYVPIWIP